MTAELAVIGRLQNDPELIGNRTGGEQPAASDQTPENPPTRRSKDGERPMTLAPRPRDARYRHSNQATRSHHRRCVG
jgi:hypothetical protein